MGIFVFLLIFLFILLKEEGVVNREEGDVKKKNENCNNNNNNEEEVNNQTSALLVFNGKTGSSEFGELFNSNFENIFYIFEPFYLFGKLYNNNNNNNNSLVNEMKIELLRELFQCKLNSQGKKWKFHQVKKRRESNKKRKEKHFNLFPTTFVDILGIWL